MVRITALALGVLTTLLGCRPQPDVHAPPSATSTIIVFAAASSADVMREAGRRYQVANPGTTVVFSFDSSSNLARQIKAGAPAHVFVSADQGWMDEAVAAGAMQPPTRADLLSNRLVLIAPAGRASEVAMGEELSSDAGPPDVGRIAVGDPAHVPAGRYARQALKSLGWWAELEPRLVPMQDVRAALRLVELGEVDAGIVYATDASGSDAVTVIGRFPEGTHEPIRYPIALCTAAPRGAAGFVEFLRSAEMASVFERAGFVVPEVGPEGRGR